MQSTELQDLISVGGEDETQSDDQKSGQPGCPKCGHHSWMPHVERTAPPIVVINIDRQCGDPSASGEGGGDKIMHEVTMPPTVSLPGKVNAGKIYDLIACVYHRGNAADSGHYVVALRTGEFSWSLFDDEIVTTHGSDGVHESDFLSDPGGGQASFLILQLQSHDSTSTADDLGDAEDREQNGSNRWCFPGLPFQLGSVPNVCPRTGCLTGGGAGNSHLHDGPSGRELVGPTGGGGPEAVQCQLGCAGTVQGSGMPAPGGQQYLNDSSTHDRSEIRSGPGGPPIQDVMATSLLGPHDGPVTQATAVVRAAPPDAELESMQHEWDAATQSAEAEMSCSAFNNITCGLEHGPELRTGSRGGLDEGCFPVDEKELERQRIVEAHSEDIIMDHVVYDSHAQYASHPESAQHLTEAVGGWLGHQSILTREPVKSNGRTQRCIIGMANVTGSSRSHDRAGNHLYRSRFARFMRLVASDVIQIAVAVDAHLDHTACQLVSRSAPRLYDGASVLCAPSSKARGKAVFKVDREGGTTCENRVGVWGSILVGLCPKLADQVQTCRALCSGRLLYIKVGLVYCFFVYGVSGASQKPDKRMWAHDILEAFNAIHESLPVDARVLVMGDMNAVVSPLDRSSKKLLSYDQAPYSLPMHLQKVGFTDLHRHLHHDAGMDKDDGDADSAMEVPPQHFTYFSHSSGLGGGSTSKSRIDQLWVNKAALQRCKSHSHISNNIGYLFSKKECCNFICAIRSSKEVDPPFSIYARKY